MGTVYKINCKKIKEVSMYMDTDMCFRDQPVWFTENNGTHTGFLTQDSIIKLISGVVYFNIFNYQLKIKQ